MDRQFAATSSSTSAPTPVATSTVARRRAGERSCATGSSSTVFVVSLLAVIAAVLVPTASALPGSRIYYTVFREQDERLAPLARLPAFADPMPSQLYYGAPYRVGGGSAEAAMARRLAVRRPSASANGDALEVVPVSGAGVVPRKRHNQAAQTAPLVIDESTATVERRAAGQPDAALQLIGKKYDRNCFFSPVQCMLSFNKNANDEVMWNSRK